MDGIVTGQATARVVGMHAAPAAATPGADPSVQADRQDFTSGLVLADDLPDARIRWRYRLVENGMAVVLPRNEVGRLASLPGVAKVWPNLRYHDLAIRDSPQQIGASNGANDNVVGGTTAAAHNIISGNQLNGVHIDTNSNGNVVEGNFIGTDVTGTQNLGNHDFGLRLGFSDSNNTLGGTVAGAGNVIAYNIRSPFTGGGVGIDNGGIRTMTSTSSLLFR